jgi:hypothetical protein
VAVVGRLGVVVEEALLREVLAAVGAHEGPFAGVDSIVDAEMGLPRVRLEIKLMKG